jgi:hypothetical protein
MNGYEDAARVAEEAARLITERGHHKDEYQDADGALCLVGAIAKAANCDPEYALYYSDNMNIVIGWLRAHLGTMMITTWNDLDETTGEDVILVLKKAAEGLRS